MSTLGSPIPREPLVDATGCVTPTWMRWFYDLFTRVGGEVAPSNGDLAIDMPEDGGTEEIRADVFALREELRQLPPPQPYIPPDDVSPPVIHIQQEEFFEAQISALSEEVAQLRARIDALEQEPMNGN